MPFDDPAPDDPMALVGIELPAGPESHREMAYAFAEEFSRMGFDEGRIARLFASPFYAAAHEAFRVLGPAEIGLIIAECCAVWGRPSAAPARDGG